MKQENIEDIYELSSMQHGMLFHTIAAPSSGAYFQQFCCTLHQLDVSAFKKAWQRVVDRHSILRTSFYWKDLDKPYQVVYQQVDLPWELLDWRKLSLQEQQRQQEAFLKADRERGFELSFAPLMRIALIKVTDDAYLLIHSHHHIILDGLSWNLLWKEFYSFYDAFRQGDDLHLERLRPYRDYIAWLQQQDLYKSEVFWRQMLKGFTLPTPLVVDKALGSFKSQDEDYERQYTHLSANMTAALKSLARKHQLTLNILFKGAWALLLSRYNNEEDIVFGVTSFGRPVALEGVESMVGLFINTLPLRVQVHSNTFLLPWLKQIQSQEVEMRRYEYSPLIQIQQWSEVPRGLPLFESLLIFNNHLVDSTQTKLAENMGVSKYQSFEKTNYPLTVAVTPNADLLQMFIAIAYDTRHFDSTTITRMLGHLETLLQAMVANPEQLLRDLPLLTAQESYQLLVKWNDTQREYPQEKCIHQLFEAQVELTPEAVAVVFENSVLTYCELNARANQLAHHLRSLGVKPEVLVGICVERSLDMVIGLLGILKAGGAYVPFDPAYPRERLALMLSDSQVSVLLTQQQLVDKLPDHKAHVVCLDKDWQSISHTSQENLASSVTIANLAYVIYTSGSTGKPKGIGLCQSSLMNLLQWHFSSLYKGARTLQFASLSFDASFHEIFATWGTGGTLFILSENLRMDALGLGRFLLEQAIEKVIFPVVILQQLAESVNEHGTTPQYTKIFSSLREIITTGEQLQINQSIIRLFKSLKHCSLHNHYGPSETHVVTVFNLKKNADEWSFYPPIGKPIANTQIYILDQQFNPVPIGVTGELYIGGVSLAQGYLNRPDLTAEKFIPNPFNDQGTRLYKTGDLTCYLPDGNIKYIKRIDHQIKIRGFRIELGEIEVVLSQHRAIEQVVVLAQKDEAGNTRLVAYVVLNHESTPTTSELRSFLHPKLPSYMIPSAFVFLKELPLTPNGKVNRQALPMLDKTQPELERIFVAPRTVAEEMVAEIWKQVLGIEKVGIHDNFFELGGHSLMTTQVTSRINQALQMELPIRSLFESPTIESLIKEIVRIWGSLEVVEEIARTWKELEQISVNEVKML